MAEDHTRGVVDAIAAAIREHRVSRVRTVTMQCCCGEHVLTMDEHADHVASAVQAALELREEWTWSWPNGSAPGVPGFGFSVDTREEAEMEGSNVVCRVVSPWVSVVRGTTQ